MFLLRQCLDKSLQCKLLADPELIFAKALVTAKAMEMAECSTKGLHSEPTGQVGQLWQSELLFSRDMLEKYMI